MLCSTVRFIVSLLGLAVLAGCNPSAPSVIIGTDAGSTTQIREVNALTQQTRISSMPFGEAFKGGVRVAVGDVNGDGTADIITGAGPGGSPQVIVRSGKDQSTLHDLLAFSADFTGGVFVAAGDVNGDGKADLVVGADSGAGPQVKVFDGSNANTLFSFFAYDAGFAGGVRVAAGDVNGDGRADIVTGCGAGAGPHVKVFSGADLRPLHDFFAFASTFTGGVYVAAGDINGDAKADVICGAGSGGGPQVKVFNGVTGEVHLDFFAFDTNFTGGVRVAAGDVNGDATSDIVLAAGAGGGPHVRILNGKNLAVLGDFFARESNFNDGLFIAVLPAVQNAGTNFLLPFLEGANFR